MLSPLDDEGRSVRLNFHGECRLEFRQKLALPTGVFLSLVSFARSLRLAGREPCQRVKHVKILNQ
jgi:hypothetical protein